MRRPFQLAVFGGRCSLTRDDYGIPSRLACRQANCFAQPAFDAVPHYGVAHAFAGHETEARTIQSVGRNAHYQQTVGRAPPVSMDF